VKILIVEDEKKMADTLASGIQEENHVVTVAYDGREGFEFASSTHFDVIVLDVMLPKMDGFEVARQLRRNGNQTPILMLTARDTAPDIVKGLDCGADDYLPKPFPFDVLLARLRALARRGPASQPPVMRLADLDLNPATREVRRSGQRIQLTKREYALLECLLRNKGKVVSRESLIEAIWGLDADIENNTLDAFVRLLRAKIDEPFPNKLLWTFRGIGYCLREEEP
jgi:DNA-binding response OmpR family regulator